MTNTAQGIRKALVGMFLGFALAAQGAEQRLVVDDMEVYYGVVPAELVQKRLDKTTEEMHAKRVRKTSRHLVVALVDKDSGQRISDANVSATVTPLGLAANQKQLEPMRINDTTTYGNFFDFPVEGARVVLHISRPNRPSHDASFEYKP